MPMSKDPKESGSNKYCSYCYVNGKLVAEGMTFQEFRKKAYEGMAQQGMNKITAWVFSQFIRLAPYWKGKTA
jgi:hypothetical protein